MNIVLRILILFVLIINFTGSIPCKKNGKCIENMDEALLIITLDGIKWNITVNYQYTECVDCKFIFLSNLTNENNYSTEHFISSYYPHKAQVIPSYLTNESFCEIRLGNLKESGVYNLEINSNKSCRLIKISEPKFESNSYLYFALIVVISLITGFNLVVYLIKRHNGKQIRSTMDFELNIQTSLRLDSPESSNKRLESLDTFRGISLLIMIFVNYGSGGYKFLEHQPWNGIALADFVQPWFLFIMGMSTSISINSLIQNKNQTKLYCVKKIFIRFIAIFAIGIVLNGFYGTMLKNLRIFGVLQRIAICYLVTALIEVFCFNQNIKKYIDSKNKYKRIFSELIWSWKQSIIIISFLTIWFLLTYLLDVPNCGKGYLGPGGLHKNGKYENCTGGAAGYIDKIVLGTSHLYGYPTCQELFKTKSFDPEGILSTLPSIFSTYLGIQAGRILVFYENPIERIIYWSIWGFFYFILFSLTSFYDLEKGPIPVNMNLWTPSFALLTGFPAFFLIAILYFFVDLKKYWHGAPLSYLGMNSILIYICHYLFSSAFPVQWPVANTHLSRVFMHLWGSVFWTCFATFLYYKRVLFNL